MNPSKHENNKRVETGFNACRCEDGLRSPKMTAPRTINMLTAIGRSEAAKKAVETRKRNRYEQEREEAIQSARRQYLYNKLSEEQREAIDDQIDSSTYSFDDELEDFVINKECEVADDIRALLREGIHPALILSAFEAGNCTVQFPTGGFTIDKKKLLDVVLREKEFRSVDTDVDEEDVSGIDYGDFDIPPALEKEGGATL
jgi:hypothetical protein